MPLTRLSRAFFTVLFSCTLILFSMIAYLYWAWQVVGSLSYHLLESDPVPPAATVRQSIQSWQFGGSSYTKGGPASAPPVPACQGRQVVEFGDQTKTSALAWYTVCNTVQEARFILLMTERSIDNSRQVTPASSARRLYRAADSYSQFWVQGTTLYQLQTSCQNQSSAEACLAHHESATQSLTERLPGSVDEGIVRTVSTALGRILAPLVLWLTVVGTVRIFRLVIRDRSPGPVGVDVTSRARRMYWAITVKPWARAASVFFGLYLLILLGIWAMEPSQGEVLPTLFALGACVGFSITWRRASGVGRGLARVQRPLIEDTLLGTVGSAMYSATRTAWTAIILIIIVTGFALFMAEYASPSLIIERRAALLNLASPSPASLWQLATQTVLLAVATDPSVLLFWALAPIALIAFVLSRIGRRLSAASLRTVVKEDGRLPPLLLLRSFDEDRAKLDTVVARDGFIPRWLRPTSRRRFEEVLVDALASYRPVTAISPPGSRLPALGAAKMTLPLHSWQGPIEEMSRRALAVVMLVTPTSMRDGFRFEVDMVANRLNHGRLMLIVGPYRRTAVRDRLARFLNVAGVYPQFASLRGLPPDGVLVLVRSSSSQWLSFGARTKTDLTYAAAIQKAMMLVTHEWEREVECWDGHLPPRPSP